MARKARPTGDKATNARKRYYRQAERYLKQAQENTGATAARYEQLARVELDNALKTYSKNTTQRFSQPIQKLANQLGVSLEDERRRIKNRLDKSADEIRKAAIDLKGRSAKSLAGRELSDEELRQEEARRLLNDDAIGSRILGGFVDVWRDKATVYETAYTEKGEPYEKAKIDNSKILPALFEYFGVDNLADMLEKVEEIIGDTLYANPDSDAMYEAVKLVIQTHIETQNNAIE